MQTRQICSATCFHLTIWQSVPSSLSLSLSTVFPSSTHRIIVMLIATFLPLVVKPKTPECFSNNMLMRSQESREWGKAWGSGQIAMGMDDDVDALLTCKFYAFFLCRTWGKSCSKVRVEGRLSCCGSCSSFCCCCCCFFLL